MSQLVALDPESGRWIAKDPARINGGGTNLYEYAYNAQANLLNPTGIAGCISSIPMMMEPIGVEIDENIALVQDVSIKHLFEVS